MAKLNILSRQSQEQEPSFRIRVDDIYRRLKKEKVWDDPKKCRKLEKALSDLESLLET
ncbi:MAG: hypothetical protein HC795_18910 [Coleofasciculaceae cyanobacterium RL_1_1]|nr:hypothetical protein [Coleofasciculaceae cyanobacterium RL_1_1]